MTSPTHAFLFFDRHGVPIAFAVDDGSIDASAMGATVLRLDGRIERMPIEEARKVRLFERQDAVPVAIVPEMSTAPIRAGK